MLRRTARARIYHSSEFRISNDVRVDSRAPIEQGRDLFPVSCRRARLKIRERVERGQEYEQLCTSPRIRGIRARGNARSDVIDLPFRTPAAGPQNSIEILEKSRLRDFGYR